jgi:hypothetical protein
MDVAALLARYNIVTPEEEEKLLIRLIEEGWDAGCWIKPPEEQILVLTQQELAEFLEGMRARPGLNRKAVDDPFPNGRHQEPVEGEEPCYVVVSMRCDIASPLKNEPLVELAPATICKDKTRIEDAWKNSPREFPLERKEQTHMVDLRYRYFISKLDLAELTARQALPLDTPKDRPRERFVLRTGQRYTRAAVPDKLVETVVYPLGKIVAKDKEANEIFTEWALYHGGWREKKPGVVATYKVDVDDDLDADEYAQRVQQIRERAEDKFEELIDKLPQEAKDELDLDNDDRTQAVAETELTVAKWRHSWKLEWDAASFTGKSDAATPAR